mmetsp:Transcript_143107/g.398749  ORF Transcript_143107/g.398749 Transcript_143107/m.398749 type:complete len:345 (-) Transcript_143107:221-1255(-)
MAKSAVSPARGSVVQRGDEDDQPAGGQQPRREPQGRLPRHEVRQPQRGELGEGQDHPHEGRGGAHRDVCHKGVPLPGQTPSQLVEQLALGDGPQDVGGELQQHHDPPQSTKATVNGDEVQLVADHGHKAERHHAEGHSDLRSNGPQHVFSHSGMHYFVEGIRCAKPVLECLVDHVPVGLRDATCIADREFFHLARKEHALAHVPPERVQVHRANRANGNCQNQHVHRLEARQLGDLGGTVEDTTKCERACCPERIGGDARGVEHKRQVRLAALVPRGDADQRGALQSAPEPREIRGAPQQHHALRSRHDGGEAEDTHLLQLHIALMHAEPVKEDGVAPYHALDK